MSSFREKRVIKAVQIPEGVARFTIKSPCGNNDCDVEVDPGDYLVWFESSDCPCVYSEQDFHKHFDASPESLPEVRPTDFPPDFLSPIFPTILPTVPAIGVNQCPNCNSFFPIGSIHVCWTVGPINGGVFCQSNGESQ